MTSLYRKWRSRSFDDLIGQPHVVRTLRNAVAGQRVAHAYLFTGPRGTGKTSMARILAKAVNCLSPDNGNPCGHCAPCIDADEGRSLDVIEIDAASNTSVEDVRDLRETVAYASVGGNYKVYIVDEVHRMSAQAFDAFLKTLEEPPPHVIFVFASTEPHKVPETIMSRCQRFDFHRISVGDTVSRLQFVTGQEGMSVDEDALRLISVHAQGSLRDALGLLDQVAAHTKGKIRAADVAVALGLADSKLVADLSDCLLDGKLGDGLKDFQLFLESGGDSRQLVRQFVDYWRALLLTACHVGASESQFDKDVTELLSRQAARLEPIKIVQVIQAMADQELSPRYSLPPGLGFEMGYVQAHLALQTATGAASPPPAAVAPRPPKDLSRVSEPVAAAPRTLEPPVQQKRAPAPGAVHTDAPGVWTAIVAAMRPRSRTLEAVLRSGGILRVEGESLTVGFPFAFHRDRFEDPSNRRLLEQVAAEVLGKPHKVICVFATPEELRASGSVGPTPDDAAFVAEAEERLRSFHAKELGNGRRLVQ
jgi:DNA polymerase III subunit gamma/tau